MRVAFFGFVLVAIGLAGCSARDRGNSTHTILLATLPPNFQPFPWPRDFGTLPLAGALVHISETEGFRYMMPLTECGLDPDALRPDQGKIAIQSTSIRVEANATLDALIRLVTFGITAQSATATDVKVGQSVAEIVPAGRVLLNARKNRAVLLEKCGAFLRQKGMFWIQEAIKSDGVEIRFYDQAGAQLKASTDSLAEFVSKVAAGVDVSATHEGAVRVSAPLYVGFHDAHAAELLTGELTVEQALALAKGDEVFASYQARQWPEQQIRIVEYTPRSDVSAGGSWAVLPVAGPSGEADMVTIGQRLERCEAAAERAEKAARWATQAATRAEGAASKASNAEGPRTRY